MGGGGQIESSSVAAYEVVGDRVRPTEHARGPWFSDQQHGAAVLALVARYLEGVPTPTAMRITRVTVDMSRAVPMREMVVRATARRSGTRVQSLEAVVHDGEQTYARAVATRIRTEDGLVDPDRLPPVYPEDVAPPFDGEPTTFDSGYDSFHDCLEIRQSGTDSCGNGHAWFRLAHPVVAGEAPTPFVRIASVADMIMSSATRLGPEWMSINPEVTMQIERPHEDEWLCVSSTVRFTEDGVGMSEGIIYDSRRRIGRAAKSTLNTRR